MGEQTKQTKITVPRRTLVGSLGGLAIIIVHGVITEKETPGERCEERDEAKLSRQRTAEQRACALSAQGLGAAA